MSQSAFSRLIRNTGIYLFGNITSKFMQILILPLLTIWVTAADFGIYQLIITAIDALTTLLTLKISDAVFRFFFDEEEFGRREVLTNSFLVIIVGTIIGVIIGVCVNLWIVKIPYLGLICFNYIAAAMMFSCQKCARSLQHNRTFVTSGIIYTFVMTLGQLVTVGYFKYGIDGLIFANGLAFYMGAFYIIYKIKLWEYVDFRYISLIRIKEMLSYSVPLVPNSICWLGLAAINDYIIAYKVGVVALGIYSVANRFPQLISFVTSVFQLSWEENAIIESKSSNRHEFYSKILEIYIKLLFSSYIVLLPLLKIVFPLLLSYKYMEGIIYIPILLLATVFSALSSYYVAFYIVSKKTLDSIYPTIVSAVINISIIFFLIDYIGLVASAIGTMLAFLVQWIYRVYQVKRYMELTISYKFFSVIFLLTGISIVCFYVIGYNYQWLVLFVSIGLFYFYNRGIINTIILKIGQYVH